MTTSITTTINVYFDTNRKIQYSPSNRIQVPPDTIATVIWKGVAPLQFVRNKTSATGLVNIAPARITYDDGPGTAPYTDTVTVTIDNTGGPPNVAASVALNIVDMASPQQPPQVIQGGGSIRNKGTSIWVWETFAAIAISLVVGVLIGRATGAGPELGPLAAGVLGLVAGFVAGAMSSRGRARAP